MRGRQRSGRGGFTAGDAAVLISLLCLAVAVVYPHFRRSAFEERVALAALDVDALRSSARAHLARAGSWPAETPAGLIPAELVEDLPPGFGGQREHYTVDWNLWEVLRPEPGPGAIRRPGDASDPDTLSVPATREAGVTRVRLLAGITVHATEEALLAALLERYGPKRSFLREGSWTLILQGPG